MSSIPNNFFDIGNYGGFLSNYGNVNNMRNADIQLNADGTPNNAGLVNFLSLIKFENHTKDENGFSEAAYYSVFPSSDSNKIETLRVFVDTSRRETLFPFQIYDGKHDKTIPKSIKSQTKARNGSDGKPRIIDLVFNGNVAEHPDSAISTDKAFNTHINIWPEKAIKLKQIKGTPGVDLDLYDSFHRIKTIRSEIIEAYFNSELTDFQKKNLIYKIFQSFLGDIDYLVSELLLNYIQNQQQNIKSKLIKFINELGKLFPNFVTQTHHGIDQVTLFEIGNTTFLYDNDNSYTNYMQINPNADTPEFELNMDKNELFEYVEKIYGTVLLGKNRDYTEHNEIFITLDPVINSNTTKYREFDSVMSELTQSVMRKKRRDILLDFFSCQLMATDMRNNEVNKKHNIVLDNGVNSSLAEITNIKNVNTVGKIFDMQGSNPQDYGTNDKKYPSDANGWDKIGYMIATECHGTRFLLYVTGKAGYPRAKATVVFIDQNDQSYIDEIEVSADKKKVSENEIYKFIASNLLLNTGLTPDQKNEIKQCFAAIAKHAGDIGMFLVNLAIWVYTLGRDNTCLATHDSWLMFFATHASLESCYNLHIDDRRSLYLPLRVVFAPSPQISMAFKTFVKMEHSNPLPDIASLSQSVSMSLSSLPASHQPVSQQPVVSPSSIALVVSPVTQTSMERVVSQQSMSLVGPSAGPSVMSSIVSSAGPSVGPSVGSLVGSLVGPSAGPLAAIQNNIYTLRKIRNRLHEALININFTRKSDHRAKKRSGNEFKIQEQFVISDIDKVMKFNISRMIYEKQIRLLNHIGFGALVSNNNPQFNEVNVPSRIDGKLTEEEDIKFIENDGKLFALIDSLYHNVVGKINLVTAGGRKKRKKKTRKVKKTRKKSKVQKKKKTKRRKKKRKYNRKKKKSRKKYIKR